jgi:glycerophosphoryl diester phosphodiesterase
VAHRGASGELLENTIGACLRAVEVGAPMVEVDVQLTADGVPVVVHDWDLGRLSADRRVVEELSAGELGAAALALDSRRGNAPTLRALLRALPPDYPLNLELKRRRAPRERLAAAVAECVAHRRQVVVSSFDHDLLAQVGAALPGVPLSPLEAHDAERLIAAGESLDAWGLHCHRRIASAALADAARTAARPLLVYTVNDSADAAALFAFGASGVFSDWPGRLMAALGKRPGPAPPAPAIAART